MVFTISYDRKFAALRGSLITLEGLIGIGKTTLGRALASYLISRGLQARFYPEYVNEEFLRGYINDMKKYSFSFQLFMLQKRIEIYREARKFAQEGGIAIIDRSINGDYTFALMQHRKGFFDEEEWNIYRSILRKEELPEPTLTIYLMCSPETSLRRVVKRGIRSEIQGYSLDYMNELHQAYIRTIQESIQHPLLELDWDTDRSINEETIEETLEIIKKKILQC